MRGLLLVCHVLVSCGVVLVGGLTTAVADDAKPEDLTTWTKAPSKSDANGFAVTVEGTTATLKNSGEWSYLRSTDKLGSVTLAATITIEKPATQLGFFGESWSVWPDHTFGDRGFEASVLLARRDVEQRPSGRRVQLSHKYQCVALVDFPHRGYVQVVPCQIELSKPIKIEVMAHDDEFTVAVDGQPKLFSKWNSDGIASIGLGSSSGATVKFADVSARKVDGRATAPPRPHAVKLAVRTWLGGRQWIFDGDEPILLLPSPESSYINNVKLRPGDRPRLSWNSHWDIQNQGAFPEGKNDTVDLQTSGGGQTLTATWRGKQPQDRFATKTKMVVGYDSARDVYTYDTDSELEVLTKEPFQFRYGYDFEHHTPLDPFGWQYLVVKRDNGDVTHRPVGPFDPGPTSDVQQYHGARVWHGRHPGTLPSPVSPVVEYDIAPDLNVDQLDPTKVKKRQLNTAVCAAFYDTGVSFAPETAAPGTKVRVKYRYTGYPADEAAALFAKSKVQDSPTIDPQHHFIFADEWPKVTFSQFVPMSESWIIGRTPFMTGHNRRPSYQLAKLPPPVQGDNLAMQLGPGAFGAAMLNKAAAFPPSGGRESPGSAASTDPTLAKPLTRGRYSLRAVVRSDNAIGPGGRIELKVFDPKQDTVLAEYTHFTGNGTRDWRPNGFAFDVPVDGARLQLGLGNSGTGDVFFNEVEFKPVGEDGQLPNGVVATANSKPPFEPNVLPGTLADYRFREGRGKHVYDESLGPFGMLELANVDWVVDEGRAAIKFTDNVTGRRDYPTMGGLDLNYLRHPAYADKQTIPLALAGHHGGGFELNGFTLASWIKPAAEMGASTHPGWGDILGVGARRIVLKLEGQQTPYKLAAALNVNDRFTSDARIEAGQWSHVALTGEPTANKHWRVKLYLNSRLVHEGETKQLASPLTIPPSIVLGTEIFYFHHAYYRGLIGRTTVLNRALTEAEILRLSQE